MLSRRHPTVEAPTAPQAPCDGNPVPDLRADLIRSASGPVRVSTSAGRPIAAGRLPGAGGMSRLGTGDWQSYGPSGRRPSSPPVPRRQVRERGGWSASGLSRMPGPHSAEVAEQVLTGASRRPLKASAAPNSAAKLRTHSLAPAPAREADSLEPQKTAKNQSPHPTKIRTKVRTKLRTPEGAEFGPSGPAEAGDLTEAGSAAALHRRAIQAQHRAPASLDRQETVDNSTWSCILPPGCHGSGGIPGPGRPGGGGRPGWAWTGSTLVPGG
jgi:hypothetical protein